MTEKIDPKTQVTIAKIGSRQAIVVALISAISGFLIALIPLVLLNRPDGPKSLPQAWLTVKRIEYLEHDENPSSRAPMGRLVIDVSGVSYSYPSKTLYTDLYSGGHYATESFPLPARLETYVVSFELIAITDLDRSAKVSTARSTQKDNVKALPYSGVYELRRVAPQGSRQQYIAARIHYELRRDL